MPPTRLVEGAMPPTRLVEGAMPPMGRVVASITLRA